MKRVAIYARYSSDLQRMESISAQVRACTYLCEQKGYEIVHIYKDEARSGRNDQREQFQQMIADSAKGIFDTVLVHKLDRFSRDAADTLYYSKLLTKNHVKLLSVTESFDDTPEGCMMKMVIMAMNQFYVMNLARETKKGQMENAYQCLTNGGRGALGYDVVNKRFVINEQEAEAVRLIFKMYDEGAGYRKIIDRLHLLGFRTKLNHEFTKASLYTILKNPKYCGTYVYNRAASADINGKRCPNRQKRLDEQVIIENGVPEIVSKEVWNRVQERLGYNQHHGSSFQAKRLYLLTGKIRCGLCGGAYHGNCRKPARNRPDYFSYRCCNRDTRHLNYCKNREIEKGEIEGFVLNQIEHHFFNDSLIPMLTKRLNEYISTNREDSGESRAAYERQLGELEKQRKNLVDAITQTGLSDTFTEKLQQVEGSIKQIHAELSRLKCQAVPPVITEEMVRAYYSKFKDYAHSGDLGKVKQVVQAYVEVVEVFPESVKVTFKVALPIDDVQQNTADYSFTQTIDRAMLKVAG